MGKHKIQAKWFNGHVATHELASSVGSGCGKSLLVAVTIPGLVASYRVIDGVDTKYDGPDFTEAVKVYNSLP